MENDHTEENFTNTAPRDLDFAQAQLAYSIIESLLEHTPHVCSQCGGAFHASLGLRMKCEQCGAEVSLRSGEDINREWVQKYYEQEYGASQDRAAGQRLAVAAAQGQGQA